MVTTAGFYIIRVKDANGCTADSTPIVVAPQLTLSAVLNKGITCNPAPTAAQITITATGGTAPFTYESKEASGSYTPMLSNVFNSSVAGSYTFRVTDANGCSAVTSTPIVTTLPVNPDITGVTPTQFINCNGDATAAISITVDNTKGQSPFVFNVYNNTLSIDYGTQTSGLRAGSYTITVTDAKGCTDTKPITITEPAKMVIEKTIIPITCDGTGISKGSIIIDKITDGISAVGGSGGTAPYTYAWSNGQTNALATALVAGTYVVTITDANGCTTTATTTVTQPTLLNATATSSPVLCNGGSTGSTSVTATGGTGGFGDASSAAAVGAVGAGGGGGGGATASANGINGGNADWGGGGGGGDYH